MAGIFISEGKTIHIVDLHFMGVQRAIASYLIPHQRGAVLVESGPGSTLGNLRAGLKSHGYDFADITDVLLTHIHLDHGGAAGWLAHQGARIYVHPNGAPHMLNPQKLLASAERIYGDMMKTLWGEFLPVPENRIHIPLDGDVIEIEDLRFRALDTPGHANHHYAYIFNDVCFSGDIGGVRMPGAHHLRLPMPPPEFLPAKWRQSLARLKQEYLQGGFHHLAPTHFGIFDDPDWHLPAIENALSDIEAWMETIMPLDPSIEVINSQFLEWTRQRSIVSGVDPSTSEALEIANPSWMSSLGIQRYWNKHRKVARTDE